MVARRADIGAAPPYRRRVVDGELDDLLGALPAISLEGPKAVGKTSTARRRGGHLVALDDPAMLEIVMAQPSLLLHGERPVVVDEWQRYPPSWDLVRRAVDADAGPGSFLLTGSATPMRRPTHSGAGRIVALRMRPMTLPERGAAEPTVSLARLLTGDRADVGGSSAFSLVDYTAEIISGGFPGLRMPAGRAQRAALDGYLERIVDTDLPELGVEVRNPATMRRWLRAYAAAVSSTASYERVRDAATGGEGAKPAKTTTILYRDALERLWIVEPLPAWGPTRNPFARLVASPKHHLADPALAARLAGYDAAALLEGAGPTAVARDGSYLGALFESLVTLTTRVFAQAAEARVGHFRTKAGEREVDLIVERGDQRVLAIEVKLSETIDDRDVRHLRWLAMKLGDDLLDAVVITTGRHAFRRADGIAVVPLALLGP